MGKISRIVIVSTFDYLGGPIVLQELCASLRRIGVDARVLYVPYFVNIHKNVSKIRYFVEVLLYQLLSCWYSLCVQYISFIDFSKHYEYAKFMYLPVQGIKRQYCPFIAEDNVVVYPEYCYGNPLGAKNVVRWLLYHNRYKNDANAYSSTDCFICYRRFFNDYELNPDERTVHIGFFDNQLYRQYNYGNREGKCYILRKGKRRNDVPTSFDGPVFDDNMSQKELVAVFNKYKYCYSYDTQTFYSSIAAVCGCISIVVLEEGKTAEDYLGDNEREHFGIAYGDSPEQIQYAIDTRPQLLESLDYSKRNEENAKTFIDYVNKRFS